MRYYYTVESEKFDDYLYIDDHDFQDNIRWLAEECADNYWSEHDGWDHSPIAWDSGLTFRIWTRPTEGAEPILHGEYLVIMEAQPTFHATIAK